MSYSVEEVAGLLGIPRPTLYRYLREYSIPHVRRAGRIEVSEEGLERVREVRELHLEGMRTEAVKRMLRHPLPDPEEFREENGRLLEAMREMRESLERVNEAFSRETTGTLLARQSLLVSALYDLNEALGVREGAGGRRGVLDALEAEVVGQRETLEKVERRLEEVVRGLEANTAAVAEFGRAMEAICEMTRYVTSVASLLKNDILLNGVGERS
ncbi:helix-turn-helix domain-containing protein [Rubrobacter calidifluminis]|uniref:helix-turn-helix domain-containing protein n=1 Tax=Rubrobacter calidifluminis TaxID=1392640 RepID=UPI002361D83B|nr:helix-turn-helix domain-containing protein [Rubrobacter calidifluminis]